MTTVEDCDEACPVAAANQVLGGKWTTLVLRDLLSGKKRYSELQRSLEGISPRMLAQRLTSLEASGIISKTIYPTIPPKTEYELTALGKEAHVVIAAMAQFGEALAIAN